MAGVISSCLQSECLIEHRIEILLYGLGLLLGASGAIRMHLHGNVGIAKAVGVHGYEVRCLLD